MSDLISCSTLLRKSESSGGWRASNVLLTLSQIDGSDQLSVVTNTSHFASWGASQIGKLGKCVGNFSLLPLCQTRNHKLQLITGQTHLVKPRVSCLCSCGSDEEPNFPSNVNHNKRVRFKHVFQRIRTLQRDVTHILKGCISVAPNYIRTVRSRTTSAKKMNLRPVQCQV